MKTKRESSREFPAMHADQDALDLTDSVRPAHRAHLACVIPMYNEAGHAIRFVVELHE
jgi:hypothetical protein